MTGSTRLKITHRYPDGRPHKGEAIFPDFSSVKWEQMRNSSLQTQDDQDRKTWINAQQRRLLRNALSKDPQEAESRVERRGSLASPWPLEVLPKPGEEIRFGSMRYLSPLSATGYQMALEIRAAALQGEDFRSMMQSIRNAGFDILPHIQRNEDGEWSYTGMRFTRGEQHLSSSFARIMIRPTPGQDRAPILSEDGEWLLHMREDYLERNRDMLEAQSRMRKEIEEIVDSARSLKAAGTDLRDAGFTALPYGADMATIRSTARFFRDGLSVEIPRKKGSALFGAARALAKLDPIPETVIELDTPEP